MGSLDFRTSQGYLTSVAEENIIKSLNPTATAPSVKTFSLFVETDSYITINDSTEKVFVSSKLGLNYNDSFKPVKSIKFDESDITYLIAYGV